MSQKANESIEFANNYCDFSDPNHIWLMKGISRSKDNPKEYHKFFRRMTLSCIEDIQESYDEIKQLGNQLGTTYRIYLSLNSRDVVKANFNFAKRLNGYAFSIEACDTRGLLKKFNNKKVDMHRDSMLFLEQYEGQVG
jgi:hypothetical protein